MSCQHRSTDRAHLRAGHFWEMDIQLLNVANFLVASIY